MSATETTIKIVTKSDCPFCTRAKALLDKMGKSYIAETIDDAGQRQLFYQANGLSGADATMPQVFINNERLGGYSQLAALVGKGGLA